MGLENILQSSKNLGDLTQAWIREVTTRAKSANVTSTVKLTVADTVSLVAPAALIAEVLRKTGVADTPGTIRVLLIGRDPMIRLDHAVWAGLAGEMIGRPGEVEIILTYAEQAITSLYPIAQALKLPHCTVIPAEQVKADLPTDVSLGIWLHPATEVDSDIEHENLCIAQQLVQHEVPLAACVFNETDLHGQNIMFSRAALKLTPIGGALRRGSPAINRFGISSADLGLEGGWGAICCMLSKTSESRHSESDVSLVKTALALLRLEGGLSKTWALGQRINGVAFNRIIPVGLLGNIAVEPVTGQLLSHDEETNRLAMLGNLWAEKLKTMPSGGEDLLIWASSIKLSYSLTFPRETEKREATIAALEQAHGMGVLDAGVALARGYEASGKPEHHEKALDIYRRIGNAHPLSAYALAHCALSTGDGQTALEHFKAATQAGYPLAMTDLAVFALQDQLDDIDPWDLLSRSASLGDPDANVYLAERKMNDNMPQEALDFLRKAWQVGHKGAIDLAFNLASYMRDQHLGNRHRLKQDLREIESLAKKLGLKLANGGN
ncbi:TPA: tetratricopeptide repeat protein [Pseudomonas aeruginosa]